MASGRYRDVIVAPVYLGDVHKIADLMKKLEMSGPTAGPEIIHQAIRYYAHAYKLHCQGYAPGFLRFSEGNFSDGSKGTFMGVRVEPFISKDPSLREIEEDMFRDDVDSKDP